MPKPKPQSKRIQFGEILPLESPLLRVRVGQASSDSGSESVEYELFRAASSSDPIVRSKKTGKWFTVPWSHIIEMAQLAGIDKTP